MAQRKLTEYLANINFPEVDRAEKQENDVLDVARRVLEPLESADEVKKDVPKPPKFTPRHEITNLFSQFTKKFTEDAVDKGVELHWIGVGTWSVPNEVVSEKHLEAWKMSHENLKMNNDKATKSAKSEARIQKILSMIQSVPLGTYQDSIDNEKEKEEAVIDLYSEYQKQINENYEQLHSRKRRIPPTLVATRFYLYKTRTPSHSIYRTVPAPANSNEQNLYEKLLKKVGHFEVVERLINLEKEFYPDDNREKSLEKIIRDWDLDIEGKWEPEIYG